MRFTQWKQPLKVQESGKVYKFQIHLITSRQLHHMKMYEQTDLLNNVTVFGVVINGCDIIATAFFQCFAVIFVYVLSNCAT